MSDSSSSSGDKTGSGKYPSLAPKFGSTEVNDNQDSDSTKNQDESSEEEPLAASRAPTGSVVDIYDYSRCSNDLEKSLQDEQNFRGLGECRKKAWHKLDEFHDILFDDEGDMWYTIDNRQNTENSWERATFHHWIRQDLFEYGRSRGEYRYTDNRTDGGQNDKTSFLYRQRDWGITQETYAPIVWQYEKKGHVDPTYINEPWHYGRRLIIDYWLEPVRTIKTLPATLTSEIEGCLIEAMRRTDLRIVLQDLRALMPPFILDKKRKGHPRRPLYDENIFSNRARHFRDSIGAIPWKERQGSVALAKVKRRINRDRVRDNKIRANDVLTQTQRERLREENRGKYPNRAKPGATFAASAAYHRMSAEDYREYKAQAQNKGRTPPRKRIVEDDDSDEEEASRKSSEKPDEDDHLSRRRRGWQGQESSEKPDEDDHLNRRLSGWQGVRLRPLGEPDLVSRIPMTATRLHQANGGAVKPQKRRKRAPRPSLETPTLGSMGEETNYTHQQPLTPLRHPAPVASDHPWPSLNDPVYNSPYLFSTAFGNPADLAPPHSLTSFNQPVVLTPHHLLTSFTHATAASNDNTTGLAAESHRPIGHPTHIAQSTAVSNDNTTASAAESRHGENETRYSMIDGNGDLQLGPHDSVTGALIPNFRPDQDDARNTRSMSILDDNYLRNALTPTVEAFVRVSGHDFTWPTGINYWTQWQALQNELNEFMPLGAPILPYRARGTGTIRDLATAPMIYPPPQYDQSDD